MMDTVHWCVFLALIFILSIKCSNGQHEDGFTYVSTTGIDNISCFNGGIGKPCQSFTYVLLNAHTSCDDNCVIIILDSQSQIINNIVFRKNQSLHVKHFNLEMVNVTFGDIQISSSGSSNMTFENLILIFGSVSFFSIQQVKFESVVIKYSYHTKIDCILYFQSVDSVIILNTYFQTSQYQETEYLVSGQVNTAVLKNCSFLGNIVKYSVLVHICAGTIIIEQCTFERYHVQLALLYIALCNAQQKINWNITTCLFNNNTAVYLIQMSETFKFNSGFVIISNTIFQENKLLNPKKYQHIDSGLIFVIANTFEEVNNYSVNHLLDNNTIKNNVGPGIAGLGYHFKFQISNTEISSNIANHSIISFLNPAHLHTNLSNVTLINTNIVNNSIPQFNATSEEPYAIVHINGGLCQIKNVTFIKNVATPLALVSTSAYFMATNTFHNNIAVYGGGIYFDNNTEVTHSENSKVVFVNNTARYGGAVYIGEYSTYIYDKNCVSQSGKVYLKFSGNSARTTGNNIYSLPSWCDCDSYHVPNITWDTGPLIVSYPTNINISNKIIEIYPGKNIQLNFSVADCDHTASTCVADVFLGCSGKVVCIYSDNLMAVRLAGPPTVFLSPGVIDTGIVIESAYDLINSTDESTQLYFQCRDPPAGMIAPIANITIHLIDCPLGLVYDTDMKQCRCAVNNSVTFLCSVQQGQVCIRKGYWYTHNMDKPIVTSCLYYSNCNFKRKKCPTDVEYIVLPQIQDDQCHDGHGGTLCMNCAENKNFTYFALKCIDKSLCHSWHPYILLLVTVTFPLLIGISLIIVVKMHSDIGSGYLYGPLFFLAVLSELPLGQYPTLDKIVSVFAASVLLQFKAFGFIPWCFFPSMNPLYSTFLQFLNPIIMFVVLLSTVFIARRCPRKFLTLQRSPIQAMCILILVSYWSLIHTSILILTPFYFNGNIVVLLQPDLQYLHKVHIPLCIISLLIMISLGVLVFLIALSQCFNFHHIKPLLDELQSCYRDKYRWYGVVYVCTWITIQVSMYWYNVFQTIILAVTLAHCLVQPYKKKWLNMCDTYLLFDLVFLTAMLSDQNETVSDTPIIREWIIYLLVMIPLCFISVGAISIITVRTGIFSLVKRLYNWWKDKCTTQQNNTQQFAPPQVIDSFIINDCEREPLIHILQVD